MRTNQHELIIAQQELTGYPACRILIGDTHMTITAYVIADEDLREDHNGALSLLYAYLRRHEGPGFVLRHVAVPNTHREEPNP